MAAVTHKILIIDDDPSWVELLKVWLNHSGFPELRTAATGRSGVELAQKEHPDCVLLDLQLPDIDGMEVCKLLRSLPELGRTPIVMLTGHRKERILGLEFGADYFVQKAENPAELLATLRAVFRRRDMDAGVLRKGDLALIKERREVFFNDMMIATLTPKTFELLHILVSRSPEPVHKEQLFALVEGKPQPELSRALDILLNRLRKALPNMVRDRVKVVKGFGYVYIPPAAPEVLPTGAPAT